MTSWEVRLEVRQLIAMEEPVSDDRTRATREIGTRSLEAYLLRLEYEWD
jgi:hypothetical protein